MPRVKYIGGSRLFVSLFVFQRGTGAVGEDLQSEIKVWNTINEC